MQQLGLLPIATLTANGGCAQKTLPRTADRDQNMHGLLPKTARCGGSYERPADTFLSGSMSDCAEKGFVRNAMQPEFSAAVRTAGLSLAVM